jgi:hypothetical protein
VRNVDVVLFIDDSLRNDDDEILMGIPRPVERGALRRPRASR